MKAPGPSYLTIETTCPHCGATATGAFCTHTDAAPKEGDLGMCIKCGGWTVYGDGMQLRRPTDAERAYIARDEDCKFAVKAYRELTNGTSAKD